MISDIRRRTDVKLDVHLVVKEPGRYVEAMKEAGADCLILQFESFEGAESLGAVLDKVGRMGMERGVSISPSTEVEKIEGLIKEGRVDVVDVLTVEPCFGGQVLKVECLEKVRGGEERS